MKIHKKTLIKFMAILLIISILSFVSYSLWIKFSNQKNDYLSNNEDLIKSFEMDKLVNNVLYVKNEISDDLEIDYIYVGNKNCELFPTLNLGINSIDLNNCITGLNSGNYEVMLISGNEKFKKSFYIAKP